MEVTTIHHYNDNAVEDAVRIILEQIEPQREGIEGTPRRVAKMFKELFSGYTMDIDVIVNGAIYDVEGSDPVYVTDIRYYSTCEHHMLPFIGRAHIAYIPSGKIIGLSKIPRIVNMFARRLQVQERLTKEIADALQNLLDPVGLMVVLEGDHMCATVRGVRQDMMKMKTRAVRGKFSLEERKEFYDLIQK